MPKARPSSPSLLSFPTPSLWRRAGALVTLAIALTLASASSSAMGVASPWREDGATATRLLAAVDSVGAAASTVSFGLEFRLDPGWKLYWRAPGDTGTPPEADWSASDNVASVAMAWPWPQRFTAFGLQTLGYHDRVILPLTVTPRTPGAALRLEGLVHYLACANVCVPHETVVTLALPAGGSPAPAPEAASIERAQAETPTAGIPAIVSAADYWRQGDGVTARITLTTTQPFQAPELILEGPDGAPFGAAEKTLADPRHVIFTAHSATLDKEALGNDDGLFLRLTVRDRTWVGEISVRAYPSPPPPPPTTAETTSLGSLGSMLLLALAGGMILNLMPCVLPVLAMKLTSALTASTDGKQRMRVRFLATGAGIVSAFLGPALTLASLKQAGSAVGWGIQFQHPVFLTAMMLAMGVFAASLLGWVTIRLPQVLATLGATRSGAGVTGDFCNGLLAAALATPCSAPFVGTAVGFALSRGVAEIILIFIAMGLGLASPWVLAAAFPRPIIALLPKPGPWMGRMQAGLALALLSTAGWLASIISSTGGTETAVGAAALLALLLTVLALRRWAPESRLGRRAVPVSALLIIAALALAWRAEPSPAPVSTPPPMWVSFDPTTLAALVADGKTVFVDVTADWCLTCIANKTMVLEREQIAAWLRDPAVIAMRADWTRPDPMIAAYLRSHGRYGIPFNALYGPLAPKGVALPELLTTAAIRAAARRAGGAPLPEP